MYVPSTTTNLNSDQRGSYKERGQYEPSYCWEIDQCITIDRPKASQDIAGVTAIHGRNDRVRNQGHLLRDCVVQGVRRRVVCPREVTHWHRRSVLANRLRRAHKRTNGSSARRLAKDRDPVLVTAERGDMLAHPVKGSNLVRKTEVTVGLPVIQREEAERGEAIVDRDEDDVAARSECAAIEGRVAPRPARECPTVNPEHDCLERGLRVLRRNKGGPDVQEQTVFTARGRARLDAFGAEVASIDGLISSIRSRILPPYRGICVRDTEELERSLVPESWGALSMLCDMSATKCSLTQ